MTEWLEEHMKRRRMSIAACLICIGSIFLLLGSAEATPPQAGSGSFTLAGTSTDGVNGYCQSPVTISYINNEVLTETTLSDGTVIDSFRGVAFATVTNDKTGKSLTFTISGPGSYTYAPDGSFLIDATGPNLLWTTVANSYRGVPQLNYTNGHAQVSVNSSGLTTSFRLDGRFTDVCAALG
jgi:hypothetical protein